MTSRKRSRRGCAAEELEYEGTPDVVPSSPVPSDLDVEEVSTPANGLLPPLVRTASTSSTLPQTFNSTKPPSASHGLTPSGKPKRKPPRPYAAPSLYSHLPPSIPDSLAPNLICIFIGLNPGVATAKAQHAFAGPTNLYWKLMRKSGVVDAHIGFKDDQRLPADYSVGITNLVRRPTAEASELSKAELVASVPSLEAKIATSKPQAVCIVGKGVWEAIHRHHTNKPLPKTFTFGWQPDTTRMGAGEDGWRGARVFVVPSTSGRVAGYSMEMKEGLWMELGGWVVEERGRRSGSGEGVKVKAVDGVDGGVGREVVKEECEGRRADTIVLRERRSSIPGVTIIERVDV
ncbi:DNA glycosylase [Saitoella complicata NRRL Y-17804]|uniref:DNA glycosylase n=1 Tax=Saitoella complicata (strain BCRC 22490 / CBS 7301 / JCM 7358 / NBRC 10748 / NRRL Y-17804) TaxID=698492 RepID=UPI000867F610|nr:DNA glycosylase [Saitoella complicata NRRL Y-17804]ODQ51004.1 DNA glycosylase [Saitoella complicata NRRL Y-17804]